MKTPDHSKQRAVSDRASILTPLLIGFATMLALVMGIAGWGASAKIAGAVISPGTVVVSSHVKPVQHPTGGVVADLKIREGQRVEAGQILLRLDATVPRANLDMLQKQLDELRVQAARLTAERDDADGFSVPDDLATHGTPGSADVIDGEKRLFASRRQAFASLIEQQRERIAQLRQEAEGIDGQSTAKDDEIKLIADELAGLKPLEKKRLVTTNRMTLLKREAARLAGERARLKASAARTRGQVSELEINILQRFQERRTEIVNTLRENQSRQAELSERAIAAKDQLKRIEMIAPQAGYVHQLSVHAPGAVIGPRQPVLFIVPDRDDLMIEAQINPAEIDRVEKGADAFVRFSTFNQQTTPLLSGAVTRISADLTRRDDIAPTYTVRIKLAPGEQTRLGDVALRPGMPADVQISTDSRTALSYLVKPFTDQIARAFRER